MHLPDGFINAGTSAGAGALAVSGVAYCVRRGAEPLSPCLTTGDTGLSFDFADACDTHDYAYDLLRFTKRGGSLLWRADRTFHEDMEAHCDTRSSTGFFLSPRSRCHAWADTYFNAVRAFHSQLRRYDPPGGPIALNGGTPVR